MKTLEEMFPDQNVDAKFELALMEALLNERLEEFLKDHNCSAAPEDVKDSRHSDPLRCLDGRRLPELSAPKHDARNSKHSQEARIADVQEYARARVVE